ncbi:Gldg family protein [Congregibacter sp.]|uniref:Gldg family protein n=1 Tax=Congregibacter sp. TaxID=2744308 RepID=UPI003F6A7BE3
MGPDAVLFRVARKELQIFFASPVAWLFLASFLATCLFVFFWVEAFFARNIADVRPLFEWMPLLLIFLSAALTMRSWSEERRSGTLEHVLTLPVPLWQFVIGKFLACALILLIALAGTLLLPFTVANIASLDWGPVLAGYLATFLVGCSYLAIGLFVSSRTDNAIVSLIGSVALCGLLYLAGSDLLLGFFGGGFAEVLRLLGSGSRFESITRGVIDLRDLYYYIAVTAAFLGLSVYALERGRWSQQSNKRHRGWRLGVSLLLLNLILAGLWLHKLPSLRSDVTQGKLYSLSQPSEELLSQLEEPLLIRGYFSERSHPLLAPLVPQLRDLLREYAVAGNRKVRVEFVDPAQDAAAEQEANEEHGIQATPFQVADRYQSSLVNAYFNVLVQYGDEKEVLGFSDFIEVKMAMAGEPEVLLRNPEFDVTRAIRDVLYRYRSSGELFDQIDKPVTLRAYVSSDTLLPELLVDYRKAIRAQAEALVPRSQNKFNIDFVEPEANNGAEAARILDKWGFQPMITAIGDENQFYFYLTLEDDHQVIQLPTGRFDSADFGDALEAGLRRFASGFTRTVALALPSSSRAQGGMPPSGHSFGTLQQTVSQDHSILMENLEDGSVDPSADLLMVMAPEALSQQGLFAIDQYLMRGGTVIIASSPRSIETQGAALQLRRVESGIESWLEHHGLRVEDTVVLDDRQAAFPVPVLRRVGDYEFREMQFVDYPYLLDIRDDGLNADHPVTRGLPNLTVAWASPLTVETRKGIESVTLLSSSDAAWLSKQTDVMPSVDDSGQSGFSAAGQVRQRATIAAALSGEFTSFFNQVPEPAAPEQNADTSIEPPSTALISKSPASSRLIVVSSNDFASDQVLSGVIAASGTQYFGPLEFLMNAVDWALQDSSLMNIRSRAHFNRTLPALPQGEQATIEYGNYAAALFFLLVIYGLWRLQGKRRQRQLGAVLK